MYTSFRFCGLALLGLALSLGAQAQGPVLTGRAPAANAPAAPRTGPLTLTFNQVLDPATANNVQVFSGQRGGQLVGTGGASASASGSTLTVQPSRSFRPGETLLVSVPATVLAAGGAAAQPAVYQVTAATGGTGRGNLRPGPSTVLPAFSGMLLSGDLDGDGDADALVLTGLNSRAVVPYLNGGNGTFTAGTPISLASTVNNLALADMNNDGILDLLTVDGNNGGAGVVSFLFGNGSGGFSGNFFSTYATGNNPGAVAVGDLNGDGRLDFVTVNNTTPGTLSVRLFDPSYALPNYVGADLVVGNGVQARDVAVGDVDNDGDLDLLASERYAGTVYVFRNNGAGTFGAGTPVSVGSSPFGLVLGDVDADGDLDLLTANPDDGTVSVRLNGGNASGVFGGGSSVPMPGQAYSLALGDVDADGDLDMVTTNSDNTASVRLNNGSGTFGPGSLGSGADNALAPYSGSTVLSDVDNDGDLDLLTLSYGANFGDPGGLNVRLNQAGPPVITSFNTPSGAVGSPLIINGTNLSGATSVRFGELLAPAGSFVANAAGTTLTGLVPVLASTNTVSVTTPAGVALSPNRFQVARASASGRFPFVSNLQLASGGDLNASANNRAKPVVTDLDNDGLLDLLVGTTNGQIRRYEQSGPQAATFTAQGNLQNGAQQDIQVSFSGGSPIAAPAVTDLDGNGLLDLLVGNQGGAVRRYEQTGPGQPTFTDLGLLSNVQVANNAVPTVTDLDGNGRLDLLVGNGNGQVLRFEQTALNATSFGTGAALAGVSAANGDAAPTVTDLDGDGLLDLLVGDILRVLTRYEQLAVGGSFTSQGTLPITSNSPALNVIGPVVTDLDGDGLLDLLVGNNNSVQRYEQAQALSLTSLSPTPNARAASGSSPVVATFNQNLTAGSSAALQVFSSQRGGRRTTATAAAVSGNALTFTPTTYNFRPGEVVNTTLTTAATGSSGEALARGRVAQFTAATGGTGGGNFRPGADVAAGTGPHGVAVGDVNGDGLPDFVAASNTSPGTVSIRLGAAGGTFGGTASVGVGNNPYAVILGDVDGDGDLDLLAGNTGSSDVSVRLNNGTGTFTGSTNVGVGASPRSVAVGDVNADGRLDFVTANGGNTASVCLGNGDGTFGAAGSVSVGGNPYAVALGDVDNDGALDLLTANYDDGTVSVRLGNGDGTFAQTGLTLTTGANPQSLTVGDLNGDNRLDVVATNTGAGTLSVFLQAGTGGLPAVPSSTLSAGTYPDAVVLGDVDADGDLDLAATNFGSNNVTVQLNGGSGTFTAPALNASPAVGAGPQGLVLADVDGDGDLDLLTANETDGTVSVLLNQPLTVPVIVDFTPKAGPAGTVVTVTGSNLGDVTGVRLGGQPVAFTSGGATSLSFTVPAAAVRQVFTLNTPVTSATSSLPFVVTQPSVAVQLPVAPLNGATSGIATGQAYIAPTVTDLDGNGRLDVLLGSQGGQLLRYEQSAAGATTFGSATALTFTSGINFTVSSGAPTITDLDGDGLLDLLVGTGGNVRRYEQSGFHQATFALTNQPLLRAADGSTALNVGGQGAAAPAVADLDGNGRLDLLVSNYNGQVRHYEQTAPDALTFTDRGLLTTDGTTPLNAGDYAHPVLTDLDGDGLLDLLFGTNTQNVHRYEQASAGSAIFAGGSLLTTNGTAPVGAYYGAPAITDLDNNGRYDLLVGDATGNLTRYEQSGPAPLPVTLVAFTATARDAAAVALAWATASEVNSARFEVERSTDGTAFVKIGQQAGAGSKTIRTDYTWLDPALPADARRLYYRLRQVDVDGTAHYSPVRNVALSGAAGLRLYPNPTSGAATITGAEPGTPVQAYDALGREVATATADAAGTATLVLPLHLARGVYTVRVGGQKPLRLVLE